MPAALPPADYDGEPRRYLMPAFTRLYRVHRRERPGEQFWPVPADAHFGGGRFDSTAEEPYPFLYAAFSERAALAETLLRSLPFDSRGERVLPRRTVQRRCISGLLTTVDLPLIALTSSPELAAVCQDAWLVQSEARDYPQTRRWARWLRDRAPWAMGLIWTSRQDVTEKVVILFGDRCPLGGVRPDGDRPVDLDDEIGAHWLNKQLAELRVSIRLPARRSP